MPPRKHLLQDSTRALEAFLSSDPPSPFIIVRTVGPPPSYSPHDPSSANPRTLFILDSSFNPPSRAHASLVLSAIRRSDASRYPQPHRLLLLFSTHNADKGAVPAAFEHRLAMIVEFARDIADRLARDGNEATPVSASTERLHDSSKHMEQLAAAAERTDGGIQIDIGLTTKPFYNDKSDAIACSDPPFYPSDPQHVHITGFDTVTRIFDAKYYSATPPLSVLRPFFERHRLRVTARAGEKVEDEQLSWAQEVLGSGELEKEGGQREWEERVEIAKAEEEGRGVSSTRIRNAVEAEDWAEVEDLCSQRVAGWVREYGLYRDHSGS